MKKEERSLKVGATSSGVGSAEFPLLKLSGKWLKESGFCYGQQVQVIVSDQQLVIKVVKS